MIPQPQQMDAGFWALNFNLTTDSSEKMCGHGHTIIKSMMGVGK